MKVASGILRLIIQYKYNRRYCNILYLFILKERDIFKIGYLEELVICLLDNPNY